MDDTDSLYLSRLQFLVSCVGKTKKELREDLFRDYQTVPGSAFLVHKSEFIVQFDTPVDIVVAKIYRYGLANVRSYSPGTAWKRIYEALDIIRADETLTKLERYESVMHQLESQVKEGQ